MIYYTFLVFATTTFAYPLHRHYQSAQVIEAGHYNYPHQHPHLCVHDCDDSQSDYVYGYIPFFTDTGLERRGQNLFPWVNPVHREPLY